jgi:hypothetical protein
MTRGACSERIPMGRSRRFWESGKNRFFALGELFRKDPVLYSISDHRGSPHRGKLCGWGLPGSAIRATSCATSRPTSRPVRIPGKQAAESGSNGPQAGAKRGSVFIIDLGGRIEARISASFRARANLTTSLSLLENTVGKPPRR